MTDVSLKEKTAKGIFWGGIGSFSQQIIGLIFGILIARILSPDDYGLISMLSIFAAIANSIMDSGFTAALINRKTIEHRDYNAVFWFSTLIGSGMYIVLFFLAPLIAQFYNQPILIDLSRLLFLSFICSSLGIAQNAFLLKNILAKQRSIIDTVSVLLSGIVGYLLALNGYVFWGLAIQVVAQSFVATLLRWIYSSWKPTFEFDVTPLKEMFDFSFKMFLTNVIAQITANILSVVFGRFYGKEQTGYYAQGSKWASLGTNVMNGLVMGIAQPVLVEAINDVKRQENVFRKMIRFGAFVSFPCMLGLAFVAKEFILITVGEKWIDSLFYLQVFCVWGSFSFLWVLYTNLLLAHGKSNKYLWGMLSISILQIIIVIAMFLLGMKIMSVAFILCYFFGMLFWHHCANKLIGLRLWNVLKDIFPYISISLLSILCAWIMTYYIDNYYLSFISKFFIVALLYIGILKKSNSVIFTESFNYLRKRI